MDRQAWLEERRKGIGASEAAAILGMNPHMSPLEVWISKVHPELLPKRDDDDFLEFGLEVEGPIERRYVRDTGNQVYKPSPAIIVHPKYPELLCTPDGLSDAPERICVEFKFERFSDGFGEIGTDEIPEHFLIQGAHQMACADRNRVDFAVLHGAPPIRVYRAYRDIELERQLIDRLRGWWSDYVLKQVEPPIDSSEAWKQYLVQKYPKAGIELRDGTELVDTFSSYIEIKAKMEALEKAKTNHENMLKAAIADASGLLFPDGTRLIWSEVKASEYVVKRGPSRRLNIKEPSCKRLKPAKSE